MDFKNKDRKEENNDKSFFVLRQGFIFVFLFVALLAFFITGFIIGQKSQPACPVCSPEEVDFSLFWEAWKTIQDKYVDKEKIDFDEMIYGAISGMIKSLDDPYTVFLNPDDSKRFIEDVRGSFSGVGMEIGIRENQLQVIAALEGTPAQRAGLEGGDKLIEVNGEKTIDMTIDEVVSLIRGPKGTEVVLTVYRDDWQETKDFKIIRDKIDVPSLKLEIREDNIAYLQIYHFSEKASNDFNQAAAKILGSQVERIILDLRNNPGGYLNVAQEIAGWFLEKGQIVVIEDFGGKKESREILSSGSGKLGIYPVIILINEFSASGSEILAGALRDNKGAMIIGETSFGKGSVQELNDLRGGSSLKITISNWLTPNGDLIANKGLDPDIRIEMTVEDYRNELDPQFDKAIELIKEIR